MFLTNNRYLISIVIVLIFWNQLKSQWSSSKLPFIVSDVVLPLVVMFLLSELLVYADKALDINDGNGQGNIGPEFMTDFSYEGSAKYNPTSMSNSDKQNIPNAEYYRQYNQQVSELMNSVHSKDDDDSVFTVEPDNAGRVDDNDNDNDNDNDVEQMTESEVEGGVNARGQLTPQMAASQINVPKLGPEGVNEVMASNAVANDTNDDNNKLGCMVGNGDCPLLCSKPHPENPCSLAAPIPGGPWQVQSAATVANRLATGQYVPAKCDIEKMELIRRRAIPQSAQ